MCSNSRVGSDLLTGLNELKEALGALELRVWCWHENLESVWLIIEDGELTITDLGDSLRYLAEAGDPLYRAVAPSEVSVICRRHGVALDVSDEERHPAICRRWREFEDLRSVVDSVAVAIDELFATAIVQ